MPTPSLKFIPHLLVLAAMSLVLWAPSARAAAGFTVEKTSGGGVVVAVNGMTFAEYVIDKANKPYLAPVFGPTGKLMTRSFPMKQVPGEQVDHPQHRGIGFSHQNISGVDTWDDQATFEPKRNGPRVELGTVRHRAYGEVSADANHAVIVSLCDVLNASGSKIYEQEHRMTFHASPEARMIDHDVRIVASEGVLMIGDSKEAGFGIRVPSSIAVESKQGGAIINSEGLTNEAAWGRRAKWCDYHGTVNGEKVGVAILNHPDSFRFPTPWHVRTYGLFAANPFGTRSLDKNAPDGAVELRQGEDLKLSHRVIFHKGDERTGRIAEAFNAYAQDARPAYQTTAQQVTAISTRPLPLGTGLPLLESLSQLAPNASEWALAPLDEGVPANVRQNLVYLREDLLDEHKQQPKASIDAYKAAHQLCSTMIATLDERDLTRVRAGYRAAQVDAAQKISTQALDARRNYMMSWPQYQREESQRAALRQQQGAEADVKKQSVKVEWAARTTTLRASLDALYAQFRAALRQ